MVHFEVAMRYRGARPDAALPRIAHQARHVLGQHTMRGSTGLSERAKRVVKDASTVHADGHPETMRSHELDILGRQQRAIGRHGEPDGSRRLTFRGVANRTMNQLPPEERFATQKPDRDGTRL